MSNEIKKAEKHTFSIELKSKEYLNLVAMPNVVKDSVLIEGFLGDLEVVELVEGVMLEIEGSNGILRLEVTQQEMEKCFMERKASKQGGVKQ
jgi:hypothetical protein